MWKLVASWVRQNEKSRRHCHHGARARGGAVAIRSPSEEDKFLLRNENYKEIEDPICRELTSHPLR